MKHEDCAWKVVDGDLEVYKELIELLSICDYQYNAFALSKYIVSLINDPNNNNPFPTLLSGNPLDQEAQKVEKELLLKKLCPFYRMMQRNKIRRRSILCPMQIVTSPCAIYWDFEILFRCRI